MGNRRPVAVLRETDPGPRPEGVVREASVFPAAEKQFVVLTLEFWQEDGQWLGRCRELGTATFAATLEQVRAELDDLVTLHLNGLQGIGEAERVLRERGVKLYSDHAPPSVPTEVPTALGGGVFVQASILPLAAAGRTAAV